MSLQEIGLILLFLVSAVYVVRKLYHSFGSQKGCESGCGSCRANISNIVHTDNKS